MHTRKTYVSYILLAGILWGSLAARITHVKGVVNAVSGLGVAFSTDSKSYITKGIIALLKLGHHRKQLQVIFQNHEDESLFLQSKIIKKEQSDSFL